MKHRTYTSSIGWPHEELLMHALDRVLDRVLDRALLAVSPREEPPVKSPS